MRKLPLALAAALLAAAPLGALAQMDHSTMNHSGRAAVEGASKEYMDAMALMDATMKNMPMTGRADMDFAMMMIPHHQAAIDMAKSYLASGDDDPELVKMANEIVAAQEREIAALKDWMGRNPR